MGQSLNAYEIFQRILELKGEKQKAAIEEFINQLRYNSLHFYRPYGHPDTLTDTGSLWLGMQDPLFLEFLKQAGFKSQQWGSWSDKPWQLDFHEAGSTHRERMQMSANRLGKTISGAEEVAIHMSGLYPEWWTGKRFDQSVLVWTGSPTTETSRDIVQKALLGGTDQQNKGTGTIPRHLIYGNPKTRQAGLADVVETIKVRHISGGVSVCNLKTYEQGWRKFQGTEPHVFLGDEEPEDNEMQGRIPSEVTTRVITSNGTIMWTFTPLLGQTKLVLKFQESNSGSLWIGNSGWDDCPHLNKKDKEQLKKDYPMHEVEARTLGIPMMGEGAIFTVPEDNLVVTPFEIPGHWFRIKGIDFGMDHPSAVADLAWDKHKNIMYVTRVWRQSNCHINTHAEAINAVDPWIPVSWPHDGMKRVQIGRGGMIQMKELYKQKGVKMLSRSARYKNDIGGRQDPWPIIKEVQEREEAGEIKYFSNCSKLLEERRNYHVKEGLIVTRREDILKAMFYAIMMKRFASMQRKIHKQDMPDALIA